MERMKEMVGVALFAFVIAAIVMWSCTSTPVVQKSHATKQVVACACEDTNWAMVSVVDHPACKDINQAEVEWVQ